MKTVQMTLDEHPVKALDSAAKKLESKHREGYKHKPVKRGEFSNWESEQVWGD